MSQSMINKTVSAAVRVTLLLAALPLATARAAEPAPAAVAPPVATTSAPAAAGAAEEDLRNTVVNILEALVQKGVLTRDQVQQIVTNAQAKTAAAAAARAQTEATTAEAEKDAVRVTYVPQVVKDQIATQAASEVRKEVAAQVIAQARSERWGVPGALPDWLRNVRFYGDVRFRVEDALYAKDNLQNFYLNFQAINSAGGIGKAGAAAILNVTQDRPRMVSRLRFGGLVNLGGDLKADFRLASGNPSNAISTNQTLGGYGARWQLGVDKAALLWQPHSRSWRQDLDLRLGRFDNPFATNGELVFDQDLMFEGASASFEWNRVRGWDERTSRWLFATVGAFPLQEVELSSKDKWLIGGQVGTEIPFSFDSKLRIAGGLYNFRNVAGQLNTPDNKLLDYTAPAALQKGNTLFDIRNDTDPSTNLFALAGKYRLLTGLVQADVLIAGENHVILSGEWVKNVGWDRADVLARTGLNLVPRTTGYEVGVAVGRPRVAGYGQWRAGFAYKHLERDAVLDSFTDSDFHLGGTDAAGYIATFDFGLTRSAFTRLRYLSANQIDGPPLGIDVLQIDLVGQF
jgi:hypothetical protein